VDLCLEDFEGARYKRIDHIQGLLASRRLDSTLRWQPAEVANALPATAN
jgi:hypothetical protein